MAGTISVWEASAWREPRDLIVVGAGITGSSAALRFLRLHPGARVTLLERGVHPGGASTRNAGFTCFGTVGESLDDLAQEPEDEVFGRIRARYEGLERLRAEIPADEVDHRITGGHELFLDPGAFERAVAAIPTFNARLRDITGHPAVYAPTQVNGAQAISIALEGHLHSGKLLQALHRRVRALGGEVGWGMPVASVEPGQVRLGSGEELVAERILLATNGFTGHFPGTPVIHPARGVVLVVGGGGVERWTGTWHADGGFLYWRDLGDRLLIGGGRNVDLEGERTREDAVNPRIQAYLLNFVRETLGVEAPMVERAWSGVMGFPEGSKSPVLTQVQPGVWVAAGLGGMGVALGVGFGFEAAEALG